MIYCLQKESKETSNSTEYEPHQEIKVLEKSLKKLQLAKPTKKKSVFIKSQVVQNDKKLLENKNT